MSFQKKGLHFDSFKWLCYLFTISSDAATKEFDLEKSMEKMVEEWSDMEFTINLYGNISFFLGHNIIVIIPENSFIPIIFDDHYL